ncbi:hypothetical protein SAMN05444157_3607 [Frankineae bacterium MT45]|nr:hypothetical protein SAMN05444157_3607 [Frankineae bacterium MT45]
MNSDPFCQIRSWTVASASASFQFLDLRSLAALDQAASCPGVRCDQSGKPSHPDKVLF